MKIFKNFMLALILPVFFVSCATSGGLVRFPSGEVIVGSESGYSDNQPAHKVNLEHAFFICNHEVTQSEYEKIMGKNPSAFPSEAAAKENQLNRPVDSVNWFDAIVYCNKLSKKEKLEPVYSLNGNTDCDSWGEVPYSASDPNYSAWLNGISQNLDKNGYRLPLESEWEYAAGQKNPENLSEYAWYEGNAFSKTHEVKMKKKNDSALFDMAGNVWEWCWDSWNGKTDYEEQAVDETENREFFAKEKQYMYENGRVRRGGSFLNPSPLCEPTFRSCYAPWVRNRALGFRVVRTDTKKK